MQKKSPSGVSTDSVSSPTWRQLDHFIGFIDTVYSQKHTCPALGI